MVSGLQELPDTWYQVKIVSGKLKTLDMVMKELLKKISLQSASLDTFDILLTF
jgi:hypothetical protein